MDERIGLAGVLAPVPVAAVRPSRKRSRAWVPIACLFLGTLVSTLDFSTGPSIQFPVLFLLPIGLGSWFGGRPMGLFLAVVLPLIRPLFLQSSWEAGPAESIVWANAVIKILAFVIFAELFHRVATVARWRARILDGLPVGMWVVDREGRVVMANPAALEIWGGNPFYGPVTEEGIRMWRHGDNRELHPWEWALVRAFLDGEETRDEILDIERPDRSRRTVSNKAVPLRDDRGKIAGALVIQEDVTASAG